jgi:hypothetical protein
MLITPVEALQLNGMAEALKRDYVAVNAKPGTTTVIRSLPK